MKLRFSKTEAVQLIVFLFLGFLIFLFAYMLIFRPLSSELTQKEQTLSMDQKLLAAYQKKNKSEIQALLTDSVGLQRKLPVKALQEHLILDIEKAAVISASSIKSIKFSSSEKSEIAETDLENGNSSVLEETDEPESTGESEPMKLPQGVKKISADLVIQSPAYEEMEVFIETIEKMERITIVEKIQFAGGEEITSLTQSDDPLTISLTISAFYMPELRDLQKDLPKRDVPKPANKRNPLSKFSDVSTTTQTEANSSP